MSLKQDFIDYVESNFNTNPLPEGLTDYWNTFKSDSKSSGDKPIFTENGFKVFKFLREHRDKDVWKSKDIAEEMFISSRTVSGCMRKLVSDGFVDKVSTDPVMYSLTDQGKEYILVES